MQFFPKSGPVSNPFPAFMDYLLTHFLIKHLLYYKSTKSPCMKYKSINKLIILYHSTLVSKKFISTILCFYFLIHFII